MEVNECNYEALSLDQACAVFENGKSNFHLWIYSVISDCISCPFSKICRVDSQRSASFVFNSAKIHTWRIFYGDDLGDYKFPNDTRDLICELKPRLGQYGLYKVTVEDSGCEIDTIRQPTNPYTPVLVIFALLLCTLLLLSSGRILTRHFRRRKPGNSSAAESTEERPTAKRRVQSIDTFRGMSILMMIFVNNGAGDYAVLEHKTWDGLFMGDLVFPSFIWIMGVCIPIALTSQLSRGVARWRICGNIIKRGFLLFFIGVCLNTIGTNAQLEKIRVFGVLQRFGVAYLVVGIIYVLLSRRQSPKCQHGILAKTEDCLSLLPQWIVILSIVAAHCGITFWLKVPGCPTGYLGPGGNHRYGEYFNCTGGAAGYIDKLILGIDHIYQHPTIDSVYGSGPFDPEGILGCLTTIFQTFLGVQAGKILRVHKNWKSRIVRWMILSLIYGVIGSVLHFRNVIPVNKNLWSVSFVLLTTSFALALLTACYLLVDVARVWNGGPFRIPGMNALIMYIGHQMCYQIFPFHWRYGAMNTHYWRTIAGLWEVSLWAIIAYIMHRKRIYISL
ncbi:heparan-alpha-glucosaminide N-acetyltransferase [Diachasma alloeum]|uniref:heparan-alpha-glucosaminide N-acetyltransferase n=1 Tax=Diachasma alloeum TaxID=454923 RepID=UPI00073832B6|nr:heparan-alpha-glucosaminide N-acetyltransferase [Diachasma alloeum]